MDFSAKLVLPYLLPNQAQKHVTLNESLRALDALVQLSVISRSEVTPPASPEDGDRYIVADGGTSAWAGWDGHVASFQDGSWRGHVPQAGWMAWVEADNGQVVFDGSAWIKPTLDAASIWGINATADAFNRLAVRAPASLFDHEGGGHQLKINKASESDTASLLFQTGYSARAEIGLVGNDDFKIKVSADGATFPNSICVQSDSGFIGIGTDSPTAHLHLNGYLRLNEVALTDLTPPAQVGAGAIIWVSDEGGIPSLAVSDGTNWRVLSLGEIIA
ncbi:MAG: DUF2793 domain-containing protein [Henriciella sp.]